MIVVTGATGKLGRLVVEGLLEEIPAQRVAIAVRDPAKAADLTARGVTARRADYAKPETLQAAFAGTLAVPMVKALTKAAGEAGRYVHWGATSQDAVDTGLVLLGVGTLLGGRDRALGWVLVSIGALTAVADGLRMVLLGSP